MYFLPLLSKRAWKSSGAAIEARTPDMPETQLNLELLFNAVTKGVLR